MNYNKDHSLSIIKKIAQKNISSDNVQIVLGRGSEKLDGFMGEILTVDITDEETRKTLNLVAKISLKDERIRGYTAIEQCYKSEIQAYQEFFPAIQESCFEFNITKPMSYSVKFYQASETQNEEYIIMENIKKDGFRMLPVRQLLNDEQAKVIFQSYGELHAHSLASRASKPQKFKEISDKNVSAFRLFLDMKVSQDLTHSIQSVREAMKEKGFNHALLDEYAGDTLGVLKKYMDFKGEKYVSFIHGDGWSNNIMFKFNERNGRLSDIKLLDWQAWTIGPPVIDILFCLFSSCSKDVFDNFDTHIKSYYDSLSNTLSLYNLNSNDIYPFQEMQDQLTKHYHFPAIFGVMIRKIRSFDENHSIDPVNYKSSDDSTWLEAARYVEFDKDYSFESLTYVFEHLDEKIIKNK